ncbi:hypothetical protein PUN28_000682 [Cardiocondyla obscurior]|uniref:Uncharacterized protein n=1 Tax=Cardiocondyla obscurior TaxID=286306 RepID=A0AAW2H0K7_9HYME
MRRHPATPLPSSALSLSPPGSLSRPPLRLRPRQVSIVVRVRLKTKKKKARWNPGVRGRVSSRNENKTIYPSDYSRHPLAYSVRSSALHRNSS